MSNITKKRAVEQQFRQHLETCDQCRNALQQSSAILLCESGQYLSTLHLMNHDSDERTKKRENADHPWKKPRAKGYFKR